MGKPFGSWFGQLVSKILYCDRYSFRDWRLPFAQIPPIYRESLEPVSKMRFDEMEHEFPFGIFRPGKQEYIFRRSVIPGNFPFEQPEKISGTFWKW